MNLSILSVLRSILPERVSFPISSLRALPLLAIVLVLSGCSRATDHYRLVDSSLSAGDAKRADLIIEQAERAYGPQSRVLYEMDRGMTLHLAGQYQASNAMLEQAEAEVERLYTRRVRTETKAFLTNDSKLPYEGDPYEQTMINVIKALNYAVMGNWNEALVEARRIDHHLNVLTDRVGAKDSYRDDGFARYLSGVLYEAAGDLNNAFIAYRKAYETYQGTRSWSRTSVPSMLRADLLRTSAAIPLNEEHEAYRREFSDVSWQPYAETKDLAQVIVVTYNGRAPRKEDRFIDLPVSLDALNLVLLNKAIGGNSSSQDRRAVESVLYGLNGHVVRVALPTLVSQKTQTAYGEVSASGTGGTFSTKTELMHNVTALAEKTLADRLAAVAIKAVARAVVKFAMAEGVSRGAQAAAGKDAGPLVGILVGIFAKAMAVASEEADKRSWRTLPDEIQLARLWLPPGEYELRVRSIGRSGGVVGREMVQTVRLQSGETKLLTERVLP